MKTVKTFKQFINEEFYNISKNNIKENKIDTIISETASDISSTKATIFLKIIETYYPEKLNHYKNVIYKKSLKDAYLEFSKQINKPIETIDKIISDKKININLGNPFGITGINRKYKESDELIPELIDLSSYSNKVDELKKNKNISKENLITLNTFFTQETFDMINNAIARLTNRHNEQLEKMKLGHTDDVIDPYTNIPINFDDENVKKRLGVFYQNESNYTKSHQLHDVNRLIQTSLNNKTISGLRWLQNNAKNLK